MDSSTFSGKGKSANTDCINGNMGVKSGLIKPRYTLLTWDKCINPEEPSIYNDK